MVSEETQKGWFHCDACGALYQDDSGPSGSRVCSGCGAAAVAVGTLSGSHGGVRKKKRRRGFPENEDGLSENSSSHKRRRGGKKKARLIALISITWVVLLIGTAVTMRIAYPDKPEESLAKPPEESMSEEDRMLMSDNRTEIAQEYARFVADSDPSSRAAHALRTPQTISKMIRIKGTSSEIVYTGKSSLAGHYVVNTPVGKGIVYVLNWETGQKVETTFFQEDGHWKLDWDEYSRYSPAATQWQPFLAGGGDDVGEYRLLARERAETGFVPPNQLAISLSLPKFGYPDETVTSSPQITVDRDSDIGIRLQKAFDARKKGEDIFGNKLVANDPDGQIRVRVKVSRKVEEDRKSFRIQELLASHWFDCGDQPTAGESAVKP